MKILFACFVGFAAALACLGCNKPQPAPQGQPAQGGAASPLVRTSADGPTFFEARDAKPSYHVTLTRGGVPDDLVLKVVPIGEYKINKEYPAAFAREGGETYEAEQFEVSDQAAVLSLSGLSPGEAVGELRFSVCTPRHCDMHKVRVGSGTAAPAPAPAKVKEVEATL